MHKYREMIQFRERNTKWSRRTSPDCTRIRIAYIPKARVENLYNTQGVEYSVGYHLGNGAKCS